MYVQHNEPNYRRCIINQLSKLQLLDTLTYKDLLWNVINGKGVVLLVSLSGEDIHTPNNWV